MPDDAFSRDPYVRDNLFYNNTLNEFHNKLSLEIKFEAVNFTPSIIWAWTQGNVPSEICAKRRLKPDCAFAQIHQSFCCPREQTLCPLLFKMWSDYANTQVDLNDRRTYMSECTFSDVVGHFMKVQYFIELSTALLRKQMIVNLNSNP